MSRLGEEGGFSLVESVMAATLLAIVLGATLIVLDAFGRNERTNERQTEAQQESRQTMTTIARDLRNVASPTNQLPRAIEKADPYDIVYQMVDRAKPAGSMNDRNVKRVRYCLDAVDPQRGRIWRQEQPWTTATAPAAPATNTCPDAAWPSLPDSTSNAALAADFLVNRAVQPSASPVFTYYATSLEDVTAVDLGLVVDVNPGARPVEVRLQSGVFLRNQNRRPKASFTATDVGAHRVLLNGSASEDPEGGTIKTYVWYADGGSQPIANGIIAYWTPPGTTFPQTHSFRLEVCDPAFPPRTDSATGHQVCDPNGLNGDATVTGVVVQ